MGHRALRHRVRGRTRTHRAAAARVRHDVVRPPHRAHVDDDPPRPRRRVGPVLGRESSGPRRGGLPRRGAHRRLDRGVDRRHLRVPVRRRHRGDRAHRRHLSLRLGAVEARLPAVLVRGVLRGGARFHRSSPGVARRASSGMAHRLGEVECAHGAEDSRARRRRGRGRRPRPRSGASRRRRGTAVGPRHRVGRRHASDPEPSRRHPRSARRQQQCRRRSRSRPSNRPTGG